MISHTVKCIFIMQNACMQIKTGSVYRMSGVSVRMCMLLFFVDKCTVGYVQSAAYPVMVMVTHPPTQFLSVCIDAGECPTDPPTDHQATHPPVRARRSESAAPATLTCWSDPDPVAEEGGAQGAVGSACNI